MNKISNISTHISLIVALVIVCIAHAVSFVLIGPGRYSEVVTDPTVGMGIAAYSAVLVVGTHIYITRKINTES